MNTVQLECFVAVAEHLNFSRASESLKISQPSVSHQIQVLEEELGVKLFSRTSKSVSLTPEGIQFLPDAELILKTACSAKERLGRPESFLPFDVGCHNYMELRLFPPLFEKLAADFPHLRPCIRVIPYPSIFELIANRKIRAAFQIKKEGKQSSLSFKELCRAQISCVCAPDHPLARHEILTQDMLSGNLISCSPRQIPAALFGAQSKIVSKLTPEQQYYAENIESALTLVKAHLGYTLCPDIPQTRDPDLCYIPVLGFAQLPFGVYCRCDDRQPILTKFLRLCRELIGQTDESRA